MSKGLKVQKSIVVTYHAECSDGFGGAWAAWKKIGNKADYFALKHGMPLPANFKNKEIYLIDFVPPFKTTRKLVKNNKRVVALDHHVSAEKIIKLAHEFRYAIDHSGSVLAWQYFHPQKPLPKLLKHIEDIDLWRFRLPFTHEILSYLQLIDYDFKKWNRVVADLEKAKTREKIIEKGKLIRSYEKKLISRLVADAKPVNFLGYRTLTVNSPVFMSEIGHALVIKKPPIGIVWRQKGDKKVFSLRSDGTVDVAKLAQRFGGGGHKAAAGFSLRANQKLPWT